MLGKATFFEDFHYPHGVHVCCGIWDHLLHLDFEDWKHRAGWREEMSEGNREGRREEIREGNTERDKSREVGVTVTSTPASNNGHQASTELDNDPFI